MRTFTALSAAGSLALSGLAFAGLVFKRGAFMAATDQRLEEIQKNFDNHLSDNKIHMSYDELSDRMVTRHEFDALGEHIRESLTRIETNVREVRAHVMQNKVD